MTHMDLHWLYIKGRLHCKPILAFSQRSPNRVSLLVDHNVGLWYVNSYLVISCNSLKCNKISLLFGLDVHYLGDSGTSINVVCLFSSLYLFTIYLE